MARAQWAAAVIGLALIAGCDLDGDRVSFDGKYFRANVKKVDKQLDVFKVTVKGVSKSFDGARAAGRHEGTDYCIKNFGTSNIIWRVGPDTPAEQLNVVNDTLTFEGTCPQR